MVAQARAELPNECCGLLAGRFEELADGRRLGRVECRYPLVNAAHSPTRYLSDAKSMLAAELDRRRRGVEFLAVYHSHPTSAPIPSRTDLEQNYSGEVVNLIISLMADVPQVKGWWLSENGFREASWTITGPDRPTQGDQAFG